MANCIRQYTPRIQPYVDENVKPNGDPLWITIVKRFTGADSEVTVVHPNAHSATNRVRGPGGPVMWVHTAGVRMK